MDAANQLAGIVLLAFGANLVIGVVLLAFGALGVFYMGLAFVATPLPRAPIEGDTEQAYPRVDRFVIPLMLPVGVGLGVAAIIFLFSQILVAAPESVATPVALVIALLILFSCAAIASARRVTRAMVLGAVAVPALALLIAGGLSYAHLHGGGKSAPASKSGAASATSAAAAPAGSGAVSGPGTNLSETTTDNKYATTSYTIKAGEQVTMVVHNNGTALHNWHVEGVKSTDGKDIVTNPLLVPPGGSATVTFTISAPGTYKFQCDVHPTQMMGTLIVQ